MLLYIVRRILWGAFLLVVVSALTFVIFTVFPSADPAALRAGRQATPELIARLGEWGRTQSPEHMRSLFA